MKAILLTLLLACATAFPQTPGKPDRHHGVRPRAPPRIVTARRLACFLRTS